MRFKVHPEAPALDPRRIRVHMHKGYSRTIATRVLTGRLALPKLDEKRLDIWSMAMSDLGIVQPGEVSALDRSYPLIDGRTMAAAFAWIRGQGIDAPDGEFLPTPLTCLGASFHHDADNYPDQVFAVVWLTEDAGWDLYFPATGDRVALELGTAVLFDSALVHGVVARGSTTFEEEAFGFDQSMGSFLSLDFQVEHPGVAKALGIEIFGSEEDSVTEKTPPEDVLMAFDDHWRDNVDARTGKWTGFRI